MTKEQKSRDVVTQNGEQQKIFHCSMQIVYFMLPPSGHTYSYPGEMPSDVQDEFVRLTEEDCQLLSCSTSVSWEWMLTWYSAIKDYFPKYSTNNIVKAFFPVNVPFDIPIFAFKRLFGED